MRWSLSHCCAPRARALADRHYPRQTQGSPRFVGPGRPLVLVTPEAHAVWVTLEQAHIDHAWPGTWACTMFRNESPHLSSELIREACAATRAMWGEPPPAGLLTFVDAEATARRRSRRAQPGECFRRAGFREVGRTKERGRVALLLEPRDFPRAELPHGAQRALFDLSTARTA